MNTATRPSLSERTQQKLENNRTKRLGKKLKLLKDMRYFDECKDYKNPKEYSGLPNGHGVYIRICGWLNGGRLLYDIKIGKGQTRDGRLTRDKGGNQGLQGVEYVYIPCGENEKGREVALALEKELLEHFQKKGWQKTDEKGNNIGGREHVHKKFASGDDKQARNHMESVFRSFFVDAPTPLKIHYRKIQQSAINHMIKALEAGHYCLALAIATGGGKTILGLRFLIQLRHLGKIKNGDVVAMVSPNKDAQQSFIDDVKNFYPDDFNIITQDELLSGKLAKDKINLLLIGTQWLSNGPEDSLNYDLLCKKYVAGLSDIKAFVFDEAHRAFFGKNKTNQTEKIAKEIMSHNPYTLWLSGTAATLLANLRKNGWLRDGGEFCFTLAQLLADPDYVDSKLPKLEYHVLKDLPEFPEENIEDLLTMDKLLDNENCVQLQKFLENVFFKTRDGVRLLHNRKHIVISVNKREQVLLVKKLLDLLRARKEYSHFKDVNIIPVTGSHSQTVTDLDDYKRKIENCDQSITITCNRWLEAVNVPQWDTLLLMNKIETYEFNFQAYGRLLRVFEGKDEFAQIYDCSPVRHLRFFFELEKELQAASQSFTEWSRKKIHSLVPVFFHDVKFQKTQLDFETFEREMNEFIFSLRSDNFWSDSDFNLDVVGSSLENINVGNRGGATRILLEVSNGKSGKDLEIKKLLNDNGLKVENDNNKLKISITDIDKVKKLFKNLDFFLEEVSEAQNWEEFKRSDKEDFQDCTSISLDIFIELVYNGLVTEEKLNNRIAEIALHRQRVVNNERISVEQH